MSFNTTTEIIEEIRSGNMVVLLDDEGRENEGDLIMAAEQVSADAINFMARYARGLICLTLSKERCEFLRLPLMVQNSGAKEVTHFTVSIEAATGVTTGISVADRARTIQAAVADNAQPVDLVQPGHVFPLMAQPGGVLNRAGHTEAGCDLARLAGFEPAAVIVEIMNDDGTMARRGDLEAFATQHNLKIGTIADLIHYRTLHERTIECIDEYTLMTEYGEFKLRTYKDNVRGDVHIALVKGDINPDIPTVVRVHVTDTLRDLLGAKKKNSSGWSISKALAKIGQESHGVLVLLAGTNMRPSVASQIEHYFSVEQHAEKENSREDSPNVYRTVGTGSQILQDIGVQKMRLLSSPIKFNALSGFDLEVVEYIPYQES